MKCTILHDTAGRIRVHLEQPRMSLLQADILEAYLRNTPGVADVTVHDRTGNATILYTGQRAPIVAALAAFSYEKSAALAPERVMAELSAMLGKRGCSMLCFTDLPLAARFAAALAEELPGWKETAELLAQREDKLKRRKAAPRKHTESGKRRK